MKTLIFVIIGLFLTSCVDKNDEQDIGKKIIKLCEIAYSEGQRDAIEGDVRIEIISDSEVVFTKTPWEQCDDNENFKCDVSLFDTIVTSKK